MILGAEHSYSFIRDGRFRLPNHGPLLVETVFGWIVAGKFEDPQEAGERSAVTCHAATVTPVNELLERFWRIEELHGPNFSVEEQKGENYYQDTISRDPTGRYIVRMPKHPDHEQMIGLSKAFAIRRLRSLEQRLSKDEGMNKQYHFLHEYITAVQESEEDDAKACYFPHHPVLKKSSSTTKLRVLVEDEGCPFPKASAAIQKNVFVDDLIGGADSTEEAIQLREELGDLLQKGGFRFRHESAQNFMVRAMRADLRERETMEVIANDDMTNKDTMMNESNLTH
nr:uncharacterized protein LOC115257811 [Aedes albopictus]